MTAPESALDLLAGLVLEDGRRWGAVAADFQWDDARAVFGAGPPWHFLTRPRGGSKSSDLAGMLLAWAACEAAPGEHGYVIATDKDQGSFAVLDAITGLVRRTPALSSLVELQSTKVVSASGATVEVLSADGASAWGLRPSFVVCDELAAWPTTRNARQLWTALVSSLAKVPGCRLVCLTSAGDPAHWSYKVLREACKSKHWRTAEVPGPLPWVAPEQLEAQRPILRDSEYSRLHLNLWTNSEDRLVSEEDLRAAAVLDGPQEPVSGRQYTIAVDLGLTRDRAIAVVAHAEPVTDVHGAPRRVVVDRIARWKGSRRQPVHLDEVEAWLRETTGLYNRARIVIDPWQAAGLAQRLRQQGLVVEEFVFSSASVGRIASALHLALRNRLILLPDDDDLLSELGNVRLKETTPGVVRLDHDAGQHDDQAVAIGLACVDLQTAPVGGGPVIHTDAEWNAIEIAQARALGLIPQAVPVLPGHAWAGDTHSGLDGPDQSQNGRMVRDP